jgi:MFS family permease
VRKPIVLGGYTLSSLVRPAMSLATSWVHVLLLRFVDRLGKGIRGAPRDALLAHVAPVEQRGRVFGFQRGMDHAGAVAGPLLASAFLYFRPQDYRTLFALTIIPGLVVIALLVTLKETPPERDPARAGAADSLRWGELPAQLWMLFGVLTVFTLGNASDAFLLLRMSDLGIAAFWIPILWAALHVVKSISSIRGGARSDRVGRRRMIAIGWVVYAIVYGGFATFDSPRAVIILFIAYGLYFGLTEGAEKALVADLTPPHLSGTAYGLYNGVLGAGALLASVAFGLVWTQVSPPAAFAMGGGLALAAAVLLYALVPEPQRHEGAIGSR